MLLRFIKPNFVFLATTLILAPLAMNAQSTASQQPPSFKTTDIHVGVFGGLVGGNYNLYQTEDEDDTYNINSNLSGGRVGVQGGVDFNLGGLVVGAAADWSWSNAQFKLDDSEVYDEDTYSGVIHSTIKQMTTIQGRLGHHFRHVLPYVHGGLLIADTELKTNDDNDLVDSSAVSGSSIHNGFVVGAGFDYFVTRHYSLSTDYGYNQVDGINLLSLVDGGESDLTAVSENFHFSTLNVGVNYHF